MHYYFQASEGASPSTDPLTLWMNGGPGCTSLKGGFEELGQLVRVTPLPPPTVATLFSVNKKLPCRSPVGARSSLSKVSIATTASY